MCHIVTFSSLTSHICALYLILPIPSVKCFTKACFFQCLPFLFIPPSFLTWDVLTASYSYFNIIFSKTILQGAPRTSFPTQQMLWYHLTSDTVVFTSRNLIIVFFFLISSVSLFNVLKIQNAVIICFNVLVCSFWHLCQLWVDFNWFFCSFFPLFTVHVFLLLWQFLIRYQMWILLFFF